MKTIIEDKLVVTEVADGPFLVGDLFQRKFGGQVPDYGHHLLALYRRDWHHVVPVGYLNLLPYETVMLVGGGCTDGRSFAYMTQADQQRVTAAGGVLYYLLRYGFERFASQCEAFFGHVGDPRAEEVDLRAGFVHTGHDNLLVNFHKPLERTRRAYLTEQIRSLGPF